MSQDSDESFVGISEAGDAMGVSRSTVWRLIRRGLLPNIRKGGRRLIPRHALARGPVRVSRPGIPPFTPDHPIFRLVGAGHGGGGKPGARDKHAILDR